MAEGNIERGWRYMAELKLDHPRIMVEEFEKAVNTDCHAAYDEISEEFKDLYQHVKRLREERNVMAQEKKHFSEQLITLQQKLESMEQQKDDYQAEWRVSQRRLAELRAGTAPESQNCDATPGPADGSQIGTRSGPKSERIPDPPLFSGGKEPCFEDWLAAMRTKLRANGDRYSTEALKMAYIQSRVGGDAADHLRPLLDEEEPSLQAQNASDLFGKLKTIYLDPNRHERAANDFQKLYMRQGDDFHHFNTHFLRLALEARVSEDKFKFEMN